MLYYKCSRFVLIPFCVLQKGIKQCRIILSNVKIVKKNCQKYFITVFNMKESGNRFWKKVR